MLLPLQVLHEPLAKAGVHVQMQCADATAYDVVDFVGTASCVDAPLVLS